MTPNLIIDERHDNGIEVTLELEAGTNNLLLRVIDLACNDHFVKPIPSESARDAFYHPFMYLLPELQARDSLIANAA